jgi:3-oxoacyl-[acyl-carrier-protein] synthase III
MNFSYKNICITGLLVVLPENERDFLNDMKMFNFSEARSLKLKEVMGYDKHRIVKDKVCVSDLAIHGLKHLFNTGSLAKDDFDSLLVVTQSPDHFIPGTSSVIQGELELKEDLLCMDITQGCAGYVVGLMQAFMLLQQPSINKVVLINGDVLSRKVSIHDRNSFPLIGDALSITVIENKDSDKVYANIKMDGRGRDALVIPAGGFRIPSNKQTSALKDVGDGNMRSEDHLRMDGAAVFNFVQSKVPGMIDELLKSSNTSLQEIDYFAFHQPNKFMLEKLADKMGVPYEKMPNNIVEKFGNSSGVTIPIVLAYNLREKLTNGKIKVCLAGFGVGLTWGSMILNLGNFKFCELIEY